MSSKVKSRKKSSRTKKVVVKVMKQNVGVDISKDDFKVSFQQLLETHHIRIKGSRTFKNNLTGFVAFLNWIDKKGISDLAVRVTMEATGVYYEQLVYFLDDHDIYVSVLLPNTTKAYAKSLNLKSKTDKIDAQMLGQMGIERNLKQWKPVSSKSRLIKQLTRDRVSMLEEKTALMNKKHALEHSHEANIEVLQRLKKRIEWTEQQIKEVDESIHQTVEQDAVLKQYADNICKAKGISILTVATILAETGCFELFTSKAQVVSFAGYDVVQKQSGTSINGKTRISKKGNKFIRRALHFPAISAVQHEEVFKKLYERVLDRTSIKMKALVAVQRKILVIIYSLCKNNQEFNPKFHQKDSEKDQEDNS